jgi:hypothetical protein
MQGHAPALAILGIEELDLCPIKIDIAPIEVHGLGDSGACVEQEDHQRPKMRSAMPDQSSSLGKREPADAPLRLSRSLNLAPLA